MNQPLISIIVPVYNIETYLKRCVESILNQTYEHMEVLLIDDGSTDDSGHICDEFAKKDVRVRVFHKENGGSSSARNLGIRQAKGDYLGFVDSDDYIEPDMYAKMVEAITQYDCNIVQISRDEIDEQGNKLPDICQMPKEAIVYPAEEFLKELILHIGDCSFCTKLLNRDLFLNSGFPEGVLNEDFHLLVKMLEKGEKIVSLPYCKYHVFYRIGSNTRKTDKQDFSRVYKDCVDNADMVYDLVCDKYPALVNVALRFGLFQRLEYLLHIPISQMKKENEDYRQVCRYVRKHFWKMLTNVYLTNKNKVYLTLFAIAPKTVRVVHAKIKRL